MYRYFTICIALLVLGGCGKIDPARYAGNQPQLDLFSYFSGETRGWGMVHNRSGELTRQFIVDIDGSIDASGILVLDERFLFSDGEQDRRTWRIKRLDTHAYEGTAGDVIGTARGRAYGNALNWSYTLNIEVDGTTWKIDFDDWMFLQDEQVLLNRAVLSKFGFRVGEITIAFVRQP